MKFFLRKSGEVWWVYYAKDGKGLALNGYLGTRGYQAAKEYLKQCKVGTFADALLMMRYTQNVTAHRNNQYTQDITVLDR